MDTCWRHLVWDCVEATNPSYACLGSPWPSFLPFLALDASPFGGYVYMIDFHHDRMTIIGFEEYCLLHPNT